jgi:SET domain-containing protein
MKKRRFVTRSSPIHGRGVFAAVKLRRGETLLEYRGRRITHDEANRRHGNSEGSGHTYYFTLNDHWVVDGDDGGNSARWINHSCTPNCEAEIHVHIGGDERRDHVLIRTLRAIRAGEELGFDYAIVLEVPHTARARRLWACRCGSQSCRGTMLAPKRRFRQSPKT